MAVIFVSECLDSAAVTIYTTNILDFKNPPLNVARRTLYLIILVTIKVNECTNLCITKI